MMDLFDPADREAIQRRLSGLHPSSPRQWGKMTAPQMLAHCSVGLEFACGDRVKKQAFLGRLLGPLVRPLVLGEKPFRQNAPTDPDFLIADERDFAEERARLAVLIEKFCVAGRSPADGRVHVFFGRLTAGQWGRLMYKHLDHHLRQFGA
jgi:hypothetical protein